VTNGFLTPSHYSQERTLEIVGENGNPGIVAGKRTYKDSEGVVLDFTYAKAASLRWK